MQPPFLVLLLLIWPEGLAHRVGRNIESLHLVDAMQVHAPLHEEVFAPWLHAGRFLGAFPVQGRHAVLKICEESAESLVADDLQVPEEAVVHILAILQVAAARGHRLAAQFCTYPHGKEDRVGIDLHSPKTGCIN